MNYFDLYTFLGQDFSPVGGTDLVSKFMNEGYFSGHKGKFKYLEVASHTGTLSRAVATLEKHECIHGIDISSLAIERANHVCQRDGLKQIQYSVQNAEHLSFENGYFDFVDLGISLGFFLENRSACMKEVVRISHRDAVIFTNNLFYVAKPPEELTSEVERILETNLDRAINYDYNFFYDFMAEYFVLDKEIIIDYERDAEYSLADYERYIRDAVTSTDAAVSKLSATEQNIFVQDYAEGRYILGLNEQYCMAALQAWKLKQNKTKESNSIRSALQLS